MVPEATPPHDGEPSVDLTSDRETTPTPTRKPATDAPVVGLVHTSPRTPRPPQLREDDDRVVIKAAKKFDPNGDHTLMLPRSPAKDIESPMKLSAKALGKQRATNYDFEFGNTSGDIRVRGKEKELIAARKTQRERDTRWQRDPSEGPEKRQYEEERDFDKERIRHLELEVLRLKDEVSALYTLTHRILIISC